MGLTNIATIDTEQLDNFKNRNYFDPGREGYDFDVVCRVRFLTTSEEIEKSKTNHPNYENRFVYPTPIEVLEDNRKNERNQEGRTLSWDIPQDIINLIVRQVGEVELKDAEMIVRADKSKKAKRYFRSEVVKRTIRKEASKIIPAIVPTIQESIQAISEPIEAIPEPFMAISEPIKDIASELKVAMEEDDKRNYNCIPTGHYEGIKTILLKAKSKEDLLDALEEVLKTQMQKSYINTKAFIERLIEQTMNELEG